MKDNNHNNILNCYVSGHRTTLDDDDEDGIDDYEDDRCNKYQWNFLVTLKVLDSAMKMDIQNVIKFQYMRKTMITKAALPSKTCDTLVTSLPCFRLGTMTMNVCSMCAVTKGYVSLISSGACADS